MKENLSNPLEEAGRQLTKAVPTGQNGQCEDGPRWRRGSMVMGRMTEVLRNCLGVVEGGWEKQMRTGAGQNQRRCRRCSRFKAGSVGVQEILSWVESVEIQET